MRGEEARERIRRIFENGPRLAGFYSFAINNPHLSFWNAVQIYSANPNVTVCKSFQGLCGEQRECINRSYSIYENNFKAKGNSSNNQKEVLLSKIEKLKVKLNNLTNMRMEGEISKTEYQEYRQKVTDEIAAFQKKLKALVEERKEPDPAVIKMSLDEFAAILVEKIDFSAPIVDRGIIEQFVEKIVPINTLEFDWYLNLIPHIFEEHSSTGYNEVWTFVINFDEAGKYRKMRGGFLRKNQWRDLTVHVFV